MNKKVVVISMAVLTLLFSLSSLKAETRLYNYRMVVEYMWSISRQSMQRTITVQAESALEAVKKTMEYRTRSYFPVDVIKLTRMNIQSSPLNSQLPEDTSVNRRR